MFLRLVQDNMHVVMERLTLASLLSSCNDSPFSFSFFFSTRTDEIQSSLGPYAEQLV